MPGRAAGPARPGRHRPYGRARLRGPCGHRAVVFPPDAGDAGKRARLEVVVAHLHRRVCADPLGRAAAPHSQRASARSGPWSGPFSPARGSAASPGMRLAMPSPARPAVGSMPRPSIRLGAREAGSQSQPRWAASPLTGPALSLPRGPPDGPRGWPPAPPASQPARPLPLPSSGRAPESSSRHRRKAGAPRSHPAAAGAARPGPGPLAGDRADPSLESDAGPASRKRGPATEPGEAPVGPWPCFGPAPPPAAMADAPPTAWLPPFALVPPALPPVGVGAVARGLGFFGRGALALLLAPPSLPPPRSSPPGGPSVRVHVLGTACVLGDLARLGLRPWRLLCNRLDDVRALDAAGHDAGGLAAAAADCRAWVATVWAHAHTALPALPPEARRAYLRDTLVPAATFFARQSRSRACTAARPVNH